MNLKLVEVTKEDFIAAFLREISPTGIYEKDELQFNSFQKGWDAAFEWVNIQAISSNEQPGKAGV